MKYFKIGYGCGCGNNEDYITAKDEKEAADVAYQEAIEEYEMFEGLHGIRGVEDIAVDDYDLDEGDIPDDLYDQIYQDYLDEREGQLDYWAEEITEHEYFIGIGEIDEDDDYEEEDEDDKTRVEHPEYYIVDAETGENRGSVVQDDYNPYIGKCAFCPPMTDKEFTKAYTDYMAEYATDDDDDIDDEEYEAAAQEGHDELVRSLVEAGGEIRELNDENKRLIYSLKETLKWLNYFLTHNRNDIYYDEASEARCRAEYLLMELEEL